MCFSLKAKDFIECYAVSVVKELPMFRRSSGVHFQCQSIQEWNLLLLLLLLLLFCASFLFGPVLLNRHGNKVEIEFIWIIYRLLIVYCSHATLILPFSLFPFLFNISTWQTFQRSVRWFHKPVQHISLGCAFWEFRVYSFEKRSLIEYSVIMDITFIRQTN